jgi:peptidoglycan hydrolase CwlO-like protein
MDKDTGIIKENKMLKKIWSTVGNYVIITLIIISCLFVFLFLLKDTSSSVFQKMLNNYMEKYRVEFQLKMDEKNKEIQVRDKKLLELNIKLQQSQTEYYKTKSELDILKRKVTTINEPKDIQETKDRLRNLGYNPN